MAVPKRVADRIQANLKNYQSILLALKARDVSEADTVTVVKDILSDVFGYDKYTELTSEFSVRGTYCDLAIKLETKLTMLLEVKAVGIELKDHHVKQAVDYASNQGCDWVILTNGIEWRLYQVVFKKPIDKQEIARINLLNMNPRSEADLECMYILSKEGFVKNAISEFRDRKDATSRFMVAAILLRSEAVQSAIRREIRRVSDILVDAEDIAHILREEVIKRETIEGDRADAAGRRVGKCGPAASRREPEEGASTKPAPAQPVPPVALTSPKVSNSTVVS